MPSDFQGWRPDVIFTNRIGWQGCKKEILEIRVFRHHSPGHCHGLFRQSDGDLLRFCVFFSVGNVNCPLASFNLKLKGLVSCCFVHCSVQCWPHLANCFRLPSEIWFAMAVYRLQVTSWPDFSVNWLGTSDKHWHHLPTLSLAVQLSTPSANFRHQQLHPTYLLIGSLASQLIHADDKGRHLSINHLDQKLIDSAVFWWFTI